MDFNNEDKIENNDTLNDNANDNANDNSNDTLNDNPNDNNAESSRSSGAANPSEKQVQYYSNGRFSTSAEIKKSDASQDSGSTGGVNRGRDDVNRGRDDVNRGRDDVNRGRDGVNRGRDDVNRGRDIGGFTGSHHYENGYDNRSKKRMPAWAKALIIIGLVILFIVLLGVGCSKFVSNLGFPSGNEVTTGFGYDYIGTVYIEDTIDEYGTGLYNHQYILNSIDAMIEDDENKGMILYVNTPGGSVYASDELYLKIKEYQEVTGRPVYSSMQSQATSGGYYISAPCDKIIANRNCWTGSIGVTMGNFYDLSEFLDNLGIKTETITSGNNKAMGSITNPMTDEQRAIFKSLIDESYEQFVSIVAEGRNMSVARVKKLADGRIYSAKQAADNGLIDQIGTYQEAVSDMMDTYDLEDCSVEDFYPEEQPELSSLLGLMQNSGSLPVGNITDADSIKQLIELNGTFRVSYICDVVK